MDSQETRGEMRVAIAKQEDNLKEEHGGIPHAWRAAEKGEHHFGKEGLDGEDQQGAQENGGHEKGQDQAVAGRWCRH